MPVDIFKLGSVEMFILLFLRAGDAHGYQLVQMLEEHSGGALTVKTASLYPLLYKLADNGYITGKETFVERKTPNRMGLSARVRIVYHLEPAGQERLNALLQEHDAFVQASRTVFSRMGRSDGDEKQY